MKSKPKSNNELRPKRKPLLDTNQKVVSPTNEDYIAIGKGVRTRDEFFHGQKGKIIHPEIPVDELYRRVVITEIDKNKNLAVQKTHNKNNGKSFAIPNDKQKRRYEREVLTLDEQNNPIRLNTGRFELSSRDEDVTVAQAKKMLRESEKTVRNKNRMDIFRRKK